MTEDNLKSAAKWFFVVFICAIIYAAYEPPQNSVAYYAKPAITDYAKDEIESTTKGGIIAGLLRISGVPVLGKLAELILEYYDIK